MCGHMFPRLASFALWLQIALGAREFYYTDIVTHFFITLLISTYSFINLCIW